MTINFNIIQGFEDNDLLGLEDIYTKITLDFSKNFAGKIVFSLQDFFLAVLLLKLNKSFITF